MAAEICNDTRDCCWRSGASCRGPAATLEPWCQQQEVGRAMLLTRPMPMRKRKFKLACTKETLVSYKQSKRHSLGSSRAHSECARSASGLFLRPAWKRCPGPASAVSARRPGVQPSDGVEQNDSQSSGVLNTRLRRARIMGKLSTHTHECPRCGAKWECGEANYQDECPYPIKTLCTKCWAKNTPKDR